MVLDFEFAGHAKGNTYGSSARPSGRCSRSFRRRERCSRSIGFRFCTAFVLEGNRKWVFESWWSSCGNRNTFRRNCRCIQNGRCSVNIAGCIPDCFRNGTCWRRKSEVRNTSLRRNRRRNRDDCRNADNYRCISNCPDI